MPKVADHDAHKLFESAVKKLEDVDIIPVGDITNPASNPTGSVSLDLQLFTPFVQGNQHEIFGAPGTGKTTIALSILGNAQQRGCPVAYVNEEGTINKSLIDSISSIDPDMKDEYGNATFHVINAPYAEKSLEAIRLFVKQKNAVVVVDSIDSMVPQAVVNSDFSDQHIGRLGKLMSRVCRDFAKILPRTGATIIWLNQVRTNPGVQYGDNKTTPGGWAVKFYSNQRIWLKQPPKANFIKDEEDNLVGMKVPFKVEKNKCIAPYVEGEIPIKFGYGIWEAYDLVNIATMLGVLEKPNRGRIMVPEFLGEFNPPFKTDGTAGAFVKHVTEFLDHSPEARAALAARVHGVLHGV